MEVLINNVSCLINSSSASCTTEVASPFIFHPHNQDAILSDANIFSDANILSDANQDENIAISIRSPSLNKLSGATINGYPVSEWNLYEARAYAHELKSPVSVGWDFVPSNFDGYHIIDSLRDNMNAIYVIAALYVVGVFLGQHFMKNRKAANLKYTTIGWNIFLALFSTICFVKFTAESWQVFWRPNFLPDAETYPDANSDDESYQGMLNVTDGSMVQRIPYGGIDGVICHTPTGYGSHAFWQLLFIASKIWEFGDTVLLIMRKKPVIFLHWFHHTTVLLLSCFIGGRNSSLRRVFANVNSGIHALMYTYYAIVAAGYRFPRSVSMTITASQLIQMVIGVYACIRSYSACLKPNGALVDHSSATFSLLIYASYLLLFAQFFYNAYIGRGKKRPDAKMASGAKIPSETVLGAEKILDTKKIDQNGKIPTEHVLRNGKIPTEHVLRNGKIPTEHVLRNGVPNGSQLTNGPSLDGIQSNERIMNNNEERLESR